MIFSPHFIAATADYSTYGYHIPAPAFRRTMTLGRVISASLTVCGLGFYEFYLNGRRLTRGHLSPYIANPDHAVYYDYYDLSNELAEGENVLGFVLGNGLQNCFGGSIWDLDQLPGRSAPKLALWFEAEGADGERITFDARNGFLWTASGILMDDLRAGEWYDARVLPLDWCTPGYIPGSDACIWREPLPAETPKGAPRLANLDPILPSKTLAPVSIRPGRIGRMAEVDPSLPSYPIPEDEQAGYMYDFGLNAAGLCRLRIRNAAPGQRLTFIFGEKLTSDGDLDLHSLFYLPTAYSQRDIYICRGDGEEIYMPSFTYHGFRYCLVTGLRPEQATPDLLAYVVMNTALGTRATFSCSDEIANRLWDATVVSDRSNFYHVPTDCPQREKNGWTGDASLSAEQMLLALTPERNLREWLCQIRAAMRDDGTLPGIVPTGGWGYGHGPAWDNVIVNLPYYIWLYRGDTSVLQENAGAILRYLGYIESRMDERGLVDYGLGDWCPAGESCVRTPTVVTSTLTCLDYCCKAEIVFAVLGQTEYATHAARVGGALRAAARAYLVDTETLTVCGHTQTAQALGIFHGLFAEKERTGAVSRLLTLIEEADGTFAGCGILGLRVLFHVLSEHGYADLAYRLITHTKFPSYGYMIACGATSLWETFHRYEDPSPSLNHHFFGDILSWFMRHVVGLQVNPHRRDPNEMRIAPAFIGALTYARGTYDAPAGRIALSWKRTDDGVDLFYTIPHGVHAELCLSREWQAADRQAAGMCSAVLAAGDGHLHLRRVD